MLLANNAYPHDSRVAREAQTLREAGYRISVVSKAVPGRPLRESVDGVAVYRYRLPGNAQSSAGYAFEFLYAGLASLLVSLRVLVREGFDVIHVHNPPDTLGLVAAVFKRLGKRVVFDHHDLSAEMYLARFDGRARPFVYRSLSRLERICCRTADMVIATNESYRLYDIERHGVDPRRTAVVRNGPLPAFLGEVEPDAAVREGADAVIGYVGEIGYQDRLDYLLRAMHTLVFELGRSRVRCLIMGRGDALEDMKQLARELQLEGNVVFTGMLRHATLPPRIAACDVCVVPDPSNSYNDRSTMIKIMEYMALSRPIVAFDLPEHRVSAGDAALYVAGNDTHAFAEAIAELLDDPERRRAMGSFGRERVERELMWSNSASSLLEAYSRMFGGS
jgi:glycosyltransferase involved in cell wall biosynthesis